MIVIDKPTQAVPFDKIETAHYLPSFNAEINECRSKLDRITHSPENPSFENTIEALERVNYKLQRLEHIFFNINAAETNEEIQKTAQELSPILTSYYNDISLNETLFKRVKEVYNKRQTLNLNKEQSKLLENTYKDFVRNGANLNESLKKEYREITEKLSALTLKFRENVLAETNSYVLNITDENDLAGLPGFVKEAAEIEAKARNQHGWTFTLKAPSYNAFLKYSDNRKLREEIYRAYNTRSFRQNDKDNQLIVKEIVMLRLKVANILGYATYADYILENRMAENPKKVISFLNDLLNRSKPSAQKDYNEIQEFARKQGTNFVIERWDWPYYSEKLKNAKFSVTDEMTKPYFRLEKVEAGIFDLANKLYGIYFSPDTNVSVYHSDVKVYRVADEDGSFLALLYIDYFPREGKQGGAWMTNFLEQYSINGEDIRPHVSLVLNFTKPTDTKPSLLTYEEVRTFLHEFGHSLHSMLSKCTYMSIAGTNVYTDFVELPSQIMENWAEQKDWLNEIAIHFETGEKMPDEMIDNILKSRNFNSGYAFLRQLGFGFIDMAWHTIKDLPPSSVYDFELEAMKPAEIFPIVEGCNISTAFAHIFGGGYAAGYYGYKWAEVLDADAFALFLQNGIFDKATARSFRENILSRGGTEDPMELYKRFRGQEPSMEPLLKRSGLDW